MIDKAAIVAAQEMVDFPNTHWDRPNRRDEVLAVARALLKVAKATMPTSELAAINARMDMLHPPAKPPVKARAARRSR
jgi:hypothetical protein